MYIPNIADLISQFYEIQLLCMMISKDSTYCFKNSGNIFVSLVPK